MDATPQDPGLRVALYSHDSVGLGHTRRNLAIAHALSEHLPRLTGRRVSGLLVTGERTATGYPCPEGWDWVVMPGIRKHQGRYAPRTLNVGMGRLMDVRSAVVDGALRSFRPHLVVVDRHPFGVDGELAGPLARLRRENPGCRMVLGLREVLDDPQAAAREWLRTGVERVSETFDEVWVYGDRRVHDPLASGELPRALAPGVHFTGYLSAGRHCAERADGTERPYLLTMAGGGSDGFEVTAAAAAAAVPAGHRHLVVTGPQMPGELRRRVRAAAAPGTTVLDSVPDGLAYIQAAAAVVVMGGYNTVSEVLSSGTPALVVPRELPRTEQLIRARSLQARGAVDLLPLGSLCPRAIAAWFAETANTAVRQRRARAALDLDGLAALPLRAARLAAGFGGLRRAVPASAASTATDPLEEAHHAHA